MELWVRSQDKKCLLKVKEIRIETENVKEYISEKELLNYKPEDVYQDVYQEEELILGSYSRVSLKKEYRYYVCQLVGYIVVNDRRIAKYSTEEKALKVLDRLEKHLDRITVVGYNEDSIWRLNRIVFQTPKDDEVE